MVYMVLFSMVLAMLAVRNLSSSFEKNMVENIGIYMAVYNKINNEDKVHSFYRNHENPYSEYIKDINSYIDYVEGIDSDNYIYSDYHISDYLTTSYQYKEDTMSGIIDSKGKKSFIVNIFQDYQSGMPYFPYKMCAVNDADFLDTHLGRIIINSGRTFKNAELELGVHYCIIPDDAVMYSYNSSGTIETRNIEIGDVITLNNSLSNRNAFYEYNTLFLVSQRYEVIGTYSNTNKSPNEKIYVPSAAFDKMWKEVVRSRLDDLFDRSVPIYVSSAIFQNDSYTQLKRLAEEIDSTGYDGIEYFSSTLPYTNVISSITAVSRSFSSIAVIGTVISLFMMAVMQVLNLYFRNREIGILEAMGERKKHIILQMMIEQAAILIISFMLSVVIMNLFKDNLVNSIIDKFLAGSVTASVLDLFSITQIKLNMKVSLSGSELLMAAGFIIIGMVISAIIISYMINKSKPKQLLEVY